MDPRIEHEDKRKAIGFNHAWPDMNGMKIKWKRSNDETAITPRLLSIVIDIKSEESKSNIICETVSIAICKLSYFCKNVYTEQEKEE